MNSQELDPRWERIEVTGLGEAGPQYVKGRCKHLETVPVETGSSEADSVEVVAHLCITCDRQLPA